MSQPDPAGQSSAPAPTLPDERKAICKACDRRTVGPFGVAICGECGCPIGSKVLLPRASCPLRKW